MTTVHADTTVTLFSRRRETSSGSCLTLTPWPPCCQSLGNTRRALRKPNKIQMKLQTVGRKETKQKKREKIAREQEQGGLIHDTKPVQLSKHGSGSSPPVGDIVAKIWVESRNPGLTLESCRAITSSRLNRESVMPSLARSCYPLLYSSDSIQKSHYTVFLAHSLLNLT